MVRTSGHTDFQGFTINPVGDVEYEAGYLHLEFRREVEISNRNLGMISIFLAHDPAMSLNNICGWNHGEPQLSQVEEMRRNLQMRWRLTLSGLLFSFLCLKKTFLGKSFVLLYILKKEVFVIQGLTLVYEEP